MLLTSRIMTGLLSGCLLVTGMGCATMHLPFGKDRMEKATARNPVTQIICIWQQSEGRDPSGMPCRGFAGQILFLAGRSSLPVQIEGDVRIYLFDDQGSSEEQSKPMHQYDFDTGAWARHLTKGTLGPTYSVFVPYTRRGTHEAKCALRIRLKPGDEPAVFSDMATIPLEGRAKKASERESTGPSSEQVKAATEAVSQSMRRTTTISMNGETTKPDAKRNQVQSAALAVLAEEAAGRVQLANYEDGGESYDPGAQRIEQLEHLVQQLLEQQGGATTEQTQRTARRVRVRDAENATSTPAHPIPARLEDDTSQHPLSDFEDGAPQPLRAASRSRRDDASNHPLTSLDDELPSKSIAAHTPAPRAIRRPDRTREQAAPVTRTILATEPLPQQLRAWSESFEPINTGAEAESATP